MQSLYISNYKKILNLKTFDKYLDKEKINHNDFDLNFFYSNQNNSKISSQNCTYLSMGVLIYKNKFNKAGLQCLIKDLENGKNLENILKSDDIRGQFAIIIVKENNIKIITDKLGYYGLYIYKKNNEIAISNSTIALAKNNKTSLNFMGIAQYLSENYKYLTYACCDQNIFNEIVYLEAGSIYELNKNGIHCSKYYNIKDNLKISKNKNFDDIVEEATSTLKNNLLFLNDENINTHCDITGGVDTRVIIALMHNQNIDFTTGSQLINQYEDFSNYGKYSEKNIINKIEKLLNLKTNITDENDYNDSKELIDEITFYLSNKQTYNRRTSHFLNIKNNNFNINISGLSGTELLRSSYYQHFKGNNELGLNDLLKEYVGLVDILKDNVFDKKSYYPHLNKYYSKNLKDLDYEKPKDLSSFIDYFAFYRTHFTRYHGLANSIVPFYTPYGDFNFAKLMYETSYDLKSKFKLQRKILENINPNLADLNCTRGFPLTTVKVSNFWRFKNMINKDIPQQYFTPMQKFKDNISYNFIKFSLKNKNIYNLMFKNRIAENPSNKKNIWGNPNDLSIINYSSTFLNSDLPIFSIIDKEKLEKYIIKDCNYNVLNRVVNLNEIIEYCN